MSNADKTERWEDGSTARARERCDMYTSNESLFPKMVWLLVKTSTIPRHLEVSPTTSNIFWDVRSFIKLPIDRPLSAYERAWARCESGTFWEEIADELAKRSPCQRLTSLLSCSTHERVHLAAEELVILLTKAQGPAAEQSKGKAMCRLNLRNLFWRFPGCFFDQDCQKRVRD